MALPPSYTWRPLRYDDLPALHTLLLATAQADGSDRVETLADLQTQFADPWSPAETQSLVVLTADAQLVAYVRFFIAPEPTSECVAHLWHEVHPAQREQGLEDAVLDWAETHAAERLRAIETTLLRELRTGTPDTLTANLARLEARGFAPIRYFYRMRRDLHAPIPDLALPADFALRTFEDGFARALHAAHEESFGDHWGHEPESFEEWKQFGLSSGNFRPEFTLLAFTGEALAAYSINRVHAADNARNATNDGHIGQVGTRRAWRKRGLASALICESMRRFKAAGYDAVTLGVDAANPTGALGLYERLGFVVVKRFVVYSKPVSQSAGEQGRK
jgi:mycothiol synthase